MYARIDGAGDCTDTCPVLRSWLLASAVDPPGGDPRPRSPAPLGPPPLAADGAAPDAELTVAPAGKRRGGKGEVCRDVSITDWIRYPDQQSSGRPSSSANAWSSPGCASRRSVRYFCKPSVAVSCRGTKRLFWNLLLRMTSPSDVMSANRRFSASETRRPVADRRAINAAYVCGRSVPAAPRFAAASIRRSMSICV